MINSSSEIFNGLIGIMPVMIGAAFYTTTVLYSQFRFKDFPTALMTQFYVMNGDTLFDTITGANQISFFYCLLWTYLWVWFGNNIIMNITLAQVEAGYLHMKSFDENKWLTKQIKDPGYQDIEDEIQMNSLTIPQALKNINIRNTEQVKANVISKMQQGIATSE